LGEPTSFLWDFGDGNTSTLQNPMHAYATAGKYSVTLTVSNGCVSDDFTAGFNIRVAELSTASFTHDAPKCPGTPVQFTDTSTEPPPLLSWSWDFGDGNTSTLQNSTHAYAAKGDYAVTLTVENKCGFSDSAPQTVTIAEIAPVVSFTHDAPKCLGQPVTFTDTGDPTSWQWDFGDGNTSTLQNPTHNYVAKGTYTVTLTASNACDVGAAQQTVTIAETAPVASFTHDAPRCLGQPVQFTDASTNSPTSWSWDFGDGDTSTLQNPTHLYAAAGTYTVTLTASNGCGSSSLSQDVVIEGTEVPIVLLSEDFNACKAPPPGWTVILGGQQNDGWVPDGPVGSDCEARCGMHLFPTNYYICDSSCLGWWSVQDDELISPVVDASPMATVTLTLEHDFYNYAAPTAVQVNVKSSNTGGAWVTLRDYAIGCSYWGDCASSGLQVLNATSECAGAADCQIEFYNNTSYYDSFWWAVDNVEIKGISLAPLASFTHNAPKCAGQAVAFTDTSTNSPTSWQWDFGDGGTSTLQHPTHVYAAKGTYTVTLTASNACGAGAPSSTTVGIQDVPAASFTHDAPKCRGREVTFTDTSTNSPTSWAWDFGDGNTSTLQNPTHTYAAAGTYTVTLTASNACGASTSAPQAVMVNPLPASDIQPDAPAICAWGPCIVLDANPSGGTPPYSFLWSTGETTQTINVSPAATTTYDVTVTDANGCTASSGETVDVLPTPWIDSVNTCFGCRAGGTGLTITGVDFGNNPSVTIGGIPVNVTVDGTGTVITCTTPGGNGIVDIVVTNPDLPVCPDSTPRQFRYISPVITSIDPLDGPTKGGLTTIEGLNFFDGETSFFVGVTEVLPDSITHQYNADIDKDGCVNSFDFITLGLSNGQQCGEFFYNVAADFNKDGAVDDTDLDILVAQFGAGCGGFPPPIPEKDTAIVDFLSGFPGIVRARRTSAFETCDGPTGWARTYGSGGYDIADAFQSTYVQSTYDGGCVVAGYSQYLGAGKIDFWVLKLNVLGEVQWEKAYGGALYEAARSIQQTSDYGYVVAGYTDSFGAGDNDFWVLKLDYLGRVEWENAYGGSGDDIAYSVQQTFAADGITPDGYIVAGYTESFGGGAWVLKLLPTGEVDWERLYDGVGYASSIQQITGGYIVAGGMYSLVTDSYDFWVAKLDTSGNVIDQKTYGGGGFEYAKSIQQTSDDGFILAGHTRSFGKGGEDYWVLKLYDSLAIEWEKTYGDGGYQANCSIHQTLDDGYILAGTLYYYDALVLKLGTLGEVQWQKRYGGPAGDVARSARQMLDGGYVVVGGTNSFGVCGDCDDLTGGWPPANCVNGIDDDGDGFIDETDCTDGIDNDGDSRIDEFSNDAWVLKTDATGNIGPACGLITDAGLEVESSSASVSTPTVSSLNPNPFLKIRHMRQAPAKAAKAANSAKAAKAAN
jgi:PKD repeat protein